MRIAFDLDDTLVPCGRSFPTAPPPGARRFLCTEPLRAGAPALIHGLLGAGHEVAVYTSSDRPRARVRLDFWSYGIGLARVVNKTAHERWAARLPRTRQALQRCLKYPPAFAIDLLVDDSHAVAEEGRALGYAVVLVDPADPTWTDAVLRALA